MASPPRKSPAPVTAWRTFHEPPPLEPTGTPLRSTLGAIAIMVGLGAVGAYMLDLHGHTCDQCGRRWRHFGAFNLGDESSHTCSRCGEVQWWKCGAPHVLRGSEFAELPRPSFAQLPSAPQPAPADLVAASRIAAPGPPMAAAFSIAASPEASGYALPPPVLSARPQPQRSPLLALQPRRLLR